MSLRTATLNLAASLPEGDPIRRKLLQAAGEPVEVDPRVVSNISRDLDKALRGLARAYKGLKGPGETTDMTVSPKERIYRSVDGKVKAYKQNSAYTSTVRYGPVNDPVEVVEAHAPYTGFGGRDAKASEDAPTLSELSSKTGLPFGSGSYRPLRVTVWKMSPEDIEKALSGWQGEFVVAKVYYSVEGYGGIGSGYVAVDRDGKYKTGNHS